MKKSSLEIICTVCGAETFIKREPRYDGLTKVGERLLCASCGHEFACEDKVPYKEGKSVRVLGEEDLSKRVDVFSDDEKRRNCRHCRHYVVNPFTQRCGLRHKAVEATDFCDDYESKAAYENPSNNG